MKRRPVQVLLTAASVGVLAGGGGVSTAATLGGAGFQSMALSALAGGVQVNGDGLAGQPPGAAAAAVPQASAEMTRSSTHGLASTAWPGSLVGNVGSLLLLLGGEPCVPGDDPVAHQPIPVVGGFCDSVVPIPQGVQDNYHYLNTPVRAEAGYPTTPHAEQGTSGAQMTADAAADAVSATALIGGGTTTDGLSFGTVTTSVDLRATGPTAAVGKASSSAQKVAVAAGVLTIDSVSSTAVATTTGKDASANGGTTVSGMKVAGVPVTVDGHGVHVDGTGPDSEAATAAAQAALAGAGIQMYITAPTKLVNGGSARYHAGSLVILWDVDQAGPKDDVIISLGGADVSSSATLPYQFVLGSPPVTTAPDPFLPSFPGSVSAPAVSQGGLTVTPAPPFAATPPDVALPRTFDLASVRFGLPFASGWAILVLFGAAFVAFGGGRLPDRLLDPTAVAECVPGVARRVE